MLKMDELEIRKRFHELTNRDQELITRMALTELNLTNAVKNIDSHDTAIRKLEKFMYTMLGLGIAANIIIELAFKAFSK
jgi:hypothetical protein